MNHSKSNLPQNVYFEKKINTFPFNKITLNNSPSQTIILPQTFFYSRTGFSITKTSISTTKILSLSFSMINVSKRMTLVFYFSLQIQYHINYFSRNFSNSQSFQPNSSSQAQQRKTSKFCLTTSQRRYIKMPPFFSRNKRLSYSMLTSPPKNEKFNPFSKKGV